MTTGHADQARSLALLLDRASADDASATEVAHARQVVEALFVEHHDRIYRLCLRYLGDQERACEVCQDTFLTAWRRLAEYHGDGSFSAWLYGIARFHCLRALEKRKDTLSEDGVVDPADPAAGPLRMLRRAERDALVREAARVLDPVEQEAVHLRYVDGVAQDQITELLDLHTASGGRGLLQACRRKLARELARLLAERGHGTSFFNDSAA